MTLAFTSSLFKLNCMSFINYPIYYSFKQLYYSYIMLEIKNNVLIKHILGSTLNPYIIASFVLICIDNN